MTDLLQSLDLSATAETFFLVWGGKKEKKNQKQNPKDSECECFKPLQTIESTL